MCRVPDRPSESAHVDSARALMAAMSTPEAPIICVTCGKPVQLAQAMLNDDGKPVHEECYVPKAKAEKRGPQQH